MEGRSGLIKDHKPVNGMYSEADYMELLALAQRIEGRWEQVCIRLRDAERRLAALVEAVKKERESAENLAFAMEKDALDLVAELEENYKSARAAVDTRIADLSPVSQYGSATEEPEGGA